RPARPAADLRSRPLPAVQLSARPGPPAARPRAAGPARRRAVHVGLLPPGRCGALAGVRGAGDGDAPERRGPVQPPRLRRGPGDALADRRPAGRPGGPANPVPAAAGPAAPLPPIKEQHMQQLSGLDASFLALETPHTT